MKKKLVKRSSLENQNVVAMNATACANACVGSAKYISTPWGLFAYPENVHNLYYSSVSVASGC